MFLCDEYDHRAISNGAEAKWLCVRMRSISRRIGSGWQAFAVAFSPPGRLADRFQILNPEYGWPTTAKMLRSQHRQVVLAEEIRQPRLRNSEGTAIDEIYVRKKNEILTNVIDWQSGAIVFVGEGERPESVKTLMETPAWLQSQDQSCGQ